MTPGGSPGAAPGAASGAASGRGPGPARQGPWGYVETAAVVLVLGFFLYSTRGILNPVVLFLVLWAVLTPFRGREGHGALLGTAAALAFIWLLSTTGTLLAPFVLAVVLAYVLDPLVDWMQERGMARSLAIVVLTLPALGVLALLVLVAAPAAGREIGSILQQVPTLFTRLADWIEVLQSRLETTNVPLVDEEALLERLREVDAQAVTAFLQERREALAGWAWEGVLGFGRGLGTVVTILGYVALTPVLTFYLLRDWDSFTPAIARLLPEGRRESVVGFAAESDRLIARYLRGQLTVALAIGTITGLGLWLVSFPYAGTLGLIVAVFSVVPYLGLVLSLVPAIVIALVSGSIWISLLKVVVVYGAAQLLEASVVSPRIVGESVGLHPVWVVFALSLGGFFFGFVGLLIGVPLAAMGKLLVLRGLDRYRSSAFYAGEGSPRDAGAPARDV